MISTKIKNRFPHCHMQDRYIQKKKKKEKEKKKEEEEEKEKKKEEGRF